MTVKTKCCVKCNKSKRAREFHRSKTGSGGLHGYCKRCQHNFYVERKSKLVKAGQCIVCALAAAEEGRTRCEGCRLRQNVSANIKYHATRSKSDTVG